MMSPVPKLPSQRPSTPSFPFIAGSYALSRWTIPYLSTTMSFRQAAEHLRLVNEFPGVERLGWRLEELYQRDVDWPRVERHIVPYLRSEEQPQFFNALTVALLPLRQNEILTGFVAGGWSPPGPLDSSNTPHSVDVGGVTVSFYEAVSGEEIPRLGQLRWNPDEVFSVAIDGQHRLAAIKQLAAAGTGLESLNRTEIPVILLILDKKLGYRGPTETTQVDLLRRLFIDLNKHAVKVDRTRQILLDDIDPHSLCVRVLVEGQLSNGTNALAKSPPQLPLGVVDWHTGSAKVDTGPYLTTILGLDWAVSKLLGAQPIADYMDYRSVDRQLQAFEKSMGITLEAAKKRLDDIEQFSIRPFSYVSSNGVNEVEQIAAAFKEVWSEAIVSLLTQFSPYKNLLELRGRQGTFTTDFTNWYYLYSRQKDEKTAGTAKKEYEQAVNHLMTRNERPVAENQLRAWLAEIEEEKANCLAFNVVFQRAMFEAFWQFSKVDYEETSVGDVGSASELLIDEDEESDDAEPGDDANDDGIALVAGSVRTHVRDFVTVLNKLTSQEPEWLTSTFACGTGTNRRQLWSGTLLKAEQTIDFTLGASSRSADIILWGPLLDLDIRQEGVAAAGTFESFWTKITDEERSFSDVQKALRRSMDRYRNNAADRILKSTDDYDGLTADEYDAKVVLELKSRLRCVWNLIRAD